ncbi:hypothetical protein [Bacillus sp. AFS019443]|uniref:hypothetical protein n=1 Tax=Bacillus sp. AFS019443 TaxID=2034279 RepID=UPI000BF60CB4|nr:hypothetical protein [Bacillus sp. AFS019443]PEU16797.1 hypothetical protein CN524_03455 [Bacillus sp. AFS019443]
MGNSKKYSFLIKCTDGTVNLTTGYGDDYNEAREYFERSLNKEWSLITDSQVIKAFIAKENETRVIIKGTEWFWEALDQLEAQNIESSESIQVNEKLEAAKKINEMEQEAKVLKRVFDITGDETLLIEALYIESDVYNLELEADLFY